MHLEEKEGRLHLSGDNLEILRLKSSIADKIGPDFVKNEGRNRFSVPIETLSLIHKLLPDMELKSNKLIHIIENEGSHQKARKKALKILEYEDEGAPIAPWNSVLDHLQAVAVNVLIIKGLKGVCLFDEQGAGKTIMAIAAFDTLVELNEIDSCIIVCPKSMMAEWEIAIDKFIPNKYRVKLIEGTFNEKYKLVTKHAEILITNFESVNKLLIALKLYARTKRTLLIADESYYIKNPIAIRSEAIRSLRKFCIRCFVMCGTPAPNSPIDLINQFDLADDGYTYAAYKPTGDVQKDGTKISKIMSDRGTYIRRLKQKILPNLPEKKFKILTVQLDGRQAQLYEEAKNNLMLWLKSMDNKSFRKNLSNYLSKRQMLLQICTCPNAIDPLFNETPIKFLTVDKLLNDLIEEKNLKVIIWSYYRQSIDDIVNRYKKFGLVRVDGSTTGNIRRDAINRFQTDKNVKLFVGNPAAAGAGITLHAASDAVYISFPSQSAQYLQSLDRIHRRGQLASEVCYYLIICKNTIEEKEIERLRKKEINQHEILGDKTPWLSSIDNALKELMDNNIES